MPFYFPEIYNPVKSWHSITIVTPTVSPWASVIVERQIAKVSWELPRIVLISQMTAQPPVTVNEKRKSWCHGQSPRKRQMRLLLLPIPIGTSLSVNGVRMARRMSNSTELNHLEQHLLTLVLPRFQHLRFRILTIILLMNCRCLRRKTRPVIAQGKNHHFTYLALQYLNSMLKFCLM